MLAFRAVSYQPRWLLRKMRAARRFLSRALADDPAHQAGRILIGKSDTYQYLSLSLANRQGLVAGEIRAICSSRGCWSSMVSSRVYQTSSLNWPTSHVFCSLISKISRRFYIIL